MRREVRTDASSGSVDGAAGAVEMEMVLVVPVVRRREHDGEAMFVVEAAGEAAEELRGGAACRLVGSDPVALDLNVAAVGQDESRDVDGVGKTNAR